MNSLKSEVLPLSEKSLNVAIGNSEYGKVYHDFKKHCHMIVAGMTGYGKTNFIQSLISQLDGEIILIDLKGGFDYDRVTATNIHEAERELTKVISKMRKRRKEHIFVIVDEAGELLPPKYLTTKEEKSPYYKCLQHCNEIARIGRGFHTHVIMATQYPTSDIIDRQIKQNCDAILCFRLRSEIASHTVLDESGAELLPFGQYGLGIYRSDRNLLVQTFLYTKREGDDLNVRKTQEKTRDDIILFEQVESDGRTDDTTA